MARTTASRSLAILFACTFLALGPLGSGLADEEDGPVAVAAVALAGVRAIPLGDGDRALFTWETDVPATSRVQYGLSPNQLDRQSGFGIQGGFDRSVPSFVTEHSAFINMLLPGRTYYYRVGSAPQDAPTAVTWSAVSSFDAKNGPSAWDGQAYTINMWIKADHAWTSADFTRWTDATRTFALLANDMTDGYVRIGTVVLEDSRVYEPNGYTMCTTCLSPADVVIPTLAPFDSHTVLGGISDGVPIVLGRFGQLVTPWRNAEHRGFVLAHEFGHWGLWLPDQYSPAGTPCVNAAYDVSIMHNSNRYSEMDHSGTPCQWQSANGGRNTWDDSFRPHYPQVPARSLPDQGPCHGGVCSGSPPMPYEIVRRDR